MGNELIDIKQAQTSAIAIKVGSITPIEGAIVGTAKRLLRCKKIASTADISPVIVTEGVTESDVDVLFSVLSKVQVFPQPTPDLTTKIVTHSLLCFVGQQILVKTVKRLPDNLGEHSVTPSVVSSSPSVFVTDYTGIEGAQCDVITENLLPIVFIRLL